MDGLDFIIVAVLSILVGVVLTLVVLRGKTSGNLRMYNDPEDGPYLFVELDTEPTIIMKKKYVIFKVNPPYTSRN